MIIVAAAISAAVASIVAVALTLIVTVEDRDIYQKCDGCPYKEHAFWNEHPCDECGRQYKDLFGKKVGCE